VNRRCKKKTVTLQHRGVACKHLLLWLALVRQKPNTPRAYVTDQLHRLGWHADIACCSCPTLFVLRSNKCQPQSNICNRPAASFGVACRHRLLQLPHPVCTPVKYKLNISNTPAATRLSRYTCHRPSHNGMRNRATDSHESSHRIAARIGLASHPQTCPHVKDTSARTVCHTCRVIE
jgi:hypothetical protein